MIRNIAPSLMKYLIQTNEERLPSSKGTQGSCRSVSREIETKIENGIDFRDQCVLACAVCSKSIDNVDEIDDHESGMMTMKMTMMMLIMITMTMVMTMTRIVMLIVMKLISVSDGKRDSSS